MSDPQVIHFVSAGPGWRALAISGWSDRAIAGEPDEERRRRMQADNERWPPRAYTSEILAWGLTESGNVLGYVADAGVIYAVNDGHDNLIDFLEPGETVDLEQVLEAHLRARGDTRRPPRRPRLHLVRDDDE